MSEGQNGDFGGLVCSEIVSPVLSGVRQKIRHSDEWQGSGLTELLLLKSVLTESLCAESGLEELRLALGPPFFQRADLLMIFTLSSVVSESRTFNLVVTK